MNVIIQRTAKIPHVVEVFNTVDYSQIAKNLPLPIIWVYDKLLGSWMPSYEVQPRALHHDITKYRIQFQEQGIIVIREMFTAQQTQVLADAFFNNPEYFKREAKSAYFSGLNRFSTHNAPMQRYYHVAISQFIASLLPSRIKPSYVFSGCYEKQSDLAKHVDSRPACSWNLSVATSASHPSLINQWPLFIESHQQRHQIHLAVGDAVLYSGVNDLHWRDQLPSPLDWALCTIFHFAPFAYTGSLD